MARDTTKPAAPTSGGEAFSSSLPFAPEDVSRRLLFWYGERGRDLPWRRTRDPYRIWLSEIMLQQTTVAAVVPYYERFLQHFPSLQILAEASLDDVIQLWAGLGYYSRARNLHQAARQIVRDGDGSFPDQLEDLMALPGIGRSTAGAIMSIAYDRPAPILDGNVRRVLIRLFAWQEDPRSSRAEKHLWYWAERLTPDAQPHGYAQAIMDLGATVCLPRNPDCRRCPLSDLCRARQLGLSAALPVKRPKKTVPVRCQAAVLVSAGDKLLVMQRPPAGLLGGLWEFPVVDVPDEQPPEQALLPWLEQARFQQKVEFVGEIRHIYSHFRLKLAVCAVSLTGDNTPDGLPGEWCSAEDAPALPLHGAHLKALHLYRQRQHADD